MFAGNNGYSLSDIAAVSGSRNGNDGDWGMGNGAWWIIILFLFCFNGNWRNGWGGNGGAESPAFQGAVTRADLCSEFNFNNLERAVAGVQQGLCDGFYAMNTSIMNGFHGVDNAVCQLGYQTQQGFNATQVALMQGLNALQAQAANCCCETKGVIRDAQFANLQGQNAIQTQIAQGFCNVGNQIDRNFAEIGYRMATDTCDIKTQIANSTRATIDNDNANHRELMNYLCQEKIADLQQENSALRLAASQQAQNNYLVSALSPKAPAPAWLVPNPAAPYNPFANNCGCGNYNNGCGCGNVA